MKPVVASTVAPASCVTPALTVAPPVTVAVASTVAPGSTVAVLSMVAECALEGVGVMLDACAMIWLTDWPNTGLIISPALATRVTRMIFRMGSLRNCGLRRDVRVGDSSYGALGHANLLPAEAVTKRSHAASADLVADWRCGFDKPNGEAFDALDGLSGPPWRWRAAAQVWKSV